MSRVRTALAGLESESHPDDATVAALATDIDSAVEYMFANCQLPPEPDIALHAVLQRLMANTSAPKAYPPDGSPVADMHETGHNYEALFDDPDNRTCPTPAGPPGPRRETDSGAATEPLRCRRSGPPHTHTPH